MHLAHATTPANRHAPLRGSCRDGRTAGHGLTKDRRRVQNAFLVFGTSRSIRTGSAMLVRPPWVVTRRSDLGIKRRSSRAGRGVASLVSPSAGVGWCRRWLASLAVRVAVRRPRATYALRDQTGILVYLARSHLACRNASWRLSLSTVKGRGLEDWMRTEPRSSWRVGVPGHPGA
jgi:hypothetical protein